MLKPAASRDASEKVFGHALRGRNSTVWPRCKIQRKANLSESEVRFDVTLSSTQRTEQKASRLHLQLAVSLKWFI